MTDSPLSRLVNDAAAAHGGASGFRLLDGAVDALAARVALADEARERLDLQYYIAHDGLTTRLLLQRLLQAADRGVHVRLLLDDLTAHGHDARFAALAHHQNVEVRFFNAVKSGRDNALARAFFMLTNMHRMHRRMHNKLWLADGSVGITGGRNLGDEYYGAASDMNFADLDLLVAGPLVADMQASFEQFWHSPYALPAEEVIATRPHDDEVRRWRIRLIDRLRVAIREKPGYVARLRDWADGEQLSALRETLVWAPGEVLSDRPDKIGTPERPSEDELLFRHLREDMRRVERELIIVSPYFVPGEEGLALLTELVRRGVDVRVLTNSLAATDLPLVHGGYSVYREALLHAGVTLHEMRARGLARRRLASLRAVASLHSKALVFDRRRAFVGSFNMDPRSVLWNTEIGVRVDSPTLAEELYHLAVRAMDGEVSYHVRLDPHGHVRWHYLGRDGQRVRRAEPGSAWRKLLAWGSRTFAPEDML